MDLMDDINYSLGLPTRAELAEMQRQQMQRQQQMMMQQQQFMMQQQGQYIPPPQAAVQEEAIASTGGGPTIIRRDGSPLELSAGMDPAIIRTKITELAGQIIGDADEFEADTPLMEAGLTSNSAVLLRD